MSRQLSAVVVGGGIGGLAAAAALARAGLQVTVLERSPGLNEVGAGLSLWPNAYRALAALGVSESVAALGAALDTGHVVRWDGKELSRQRLDLLRLFGSPGICIRRADLLAALAEAGPCDQILLESAVTSFIHDGPGVAAVLASGALVTADILVGADGLHSVVRRQLGRSEPQFTGALAWRGLARGEYGGGIMVGPDAHAGWMPTGGGETYWFACVNSVEATQPPDADIGAELAGRFAAWAEPLPALIAATPAMTVLRHDLYDHEPAATWGAGPVTLLGDAAHAMTPGLGQGACAALEDAVVLGRCLSQVSTAGDPLRAALREYERRRQRRTARLQRTSRWALRALLAHGRVGRTAQGALLRLPVSWTARGQGWIFDYDAATA